MKLGRGVDAKTFEELAARRGGMKVGLGKRQSVETKDQYRSRTGENSPDRADSALLFLHVARLNTPGLIPKAKDTETIVSGPGARPWSGFDLAFAGAKMSGLEASETADMMKD